MKTYKDSKKLFHFKILVIIIVVVYVDEVMILPVQCRIVAILTFTKNSTWNCALIAFAIFLYTMCLTTFTPFFNFFNLKSQTKFKRFLLSNFLFFLLILKGIKAMSISTKSLNNGLLVLSDILFMVTTIITVTVLSTKDFFLKTLTVKF